MSEHTDLELGVSQNHSSNVGKKIHSRKWKTFFFGSLSVNSSFQTTPKLCRLIYSGIFVSLSLRCSECCGALEHYDKAFDRITTRNEKSLKSIKRIFHTVTTTDDPVIRKVTLIPQLGSHKSLRFQFFIVAFSNFAARCGSFFFFFLGPTCP